MMKVRIWQTVLLIALSIAFCGGVFGESLWVPEKGGSIYRDKKANKEGDVLRVIIVETASSSQSASTDASKNTGFSSPVGLGPLLEEIPAFQFSNNDSVKGSGNTKRSTSLTASIAVKIVKIDDNGNMEIEGMREVQTNGEKATIRLSGTVRPQDVSQDNTILSTSIADAKIRYDGKGPIGNRQREGIIQRIFRLLF